MNQEEQFYKELGDALKEKYEEKVRTTGVVQVVNPMEYKKAKRVYNRLKATHTWNVTENYQAESAMYYINVKADHFTIEDIQELEDIIKGCSIIDMYIADNKINVDIAYYHVVEVS